MRSIGLDVHRGFCEVAIAEGGWVRSAGRIETSVEALELFASSLGADDAVALEATSGAAKIAKLIEPHVARVVVANTRKLAAISQARRRPTARTPGRWRGCWRPAIWSRCGPPTSRRGRCGA